MAPKRSRPPTPASPHRADAERRRCVLQADLRALAVPSYATLPADSRLTAAVRRQPGRLGDYLCAHGLITEADLAAALAEQHQRMVDARPISLGDLLVE